MKYCPDTRLLENVWLERCVYTRTHSLHSYRLYIYNYCINRNIPVGLSRERDCRLLVAFWHEPGYNTLWSPLDIWNTWYNKPCKRVWQTRARYDSSPDQTPEDWCRMWVPISASPMIQLWCLRIQQTDHQRTDDLEPVCWCWLKNKWWDALLTRYYNN